MMKKLMIALVLAVCGSCFAGDYTFSDYANSAGLTGNEVAINAYNKGIYDLDGLANNYDYLEGLWLSGNRIDSIESGGFDGLDKLRILYLDNNEITSVESGDFAGLNNLESLILMNNQISSLESSCFDGLTNLETLHLDWNLITSIECASFAGLDNLQKLILDHNHGLSGEDVVALLEALDSLSLLSVQGVFYEWDKNVQDQLLAWDAIDGHRLHYVPEPMSLVLLGLGGLVLRRRRG